MKINRYCLLITDYYVLQSIGLLQGRTIKVIDISNKLHRMDVEVK